MPPPERADYVCSRHWETRQINDELANTEGLITETENVIARGYRLHRSCEFVPVTVSKEERCKTNKDGEKVCKETSDLKHAEVCKDLPVAIDGQFEREKLSEYRGRHRSLEAEYNRSYDACFAQVRPMSAQQAFDYFQSVKDGF